MTGTEAGRAAEGGVIARMTWDDPYRDSISGILTAERTAAEVSFVVEHAGVRPPAAVVDFGCGHGRHAIELARRGFVVTGVDRNPGSLALARQAAGPGLAVTFVEADYSEGPRGPFDLVLSLFGSFGFGSDEENARTVHGWCERLAAGGSLVMDLWHRDMIVSKFVPQRTWRASGELEVDETRAFDPSSGRLQVRYVYRYADGRRQARELAVRLYTAAELRTMLSEGGLVVSGLFGSLRGDPYSSGAASLVIAGRKAY